MTDLGQQRQPDRHKFALVLSGGGIRAMAQIGVIDVLHEYGLQPDVVVGTSGGAIVGSLYAAGKSPRQLAEIALSWRHRGRQLIDYNWLGLLMCLLRGSLRPFTGVVRGSRIARVLRAEIAPYVRFQQLNGTRGTRPLFVTSVDLNDGSPVVFCDPASVGGALHPVSGECEGYFICGREGIVEAVRASYSIPGVFVPARCDAANHGGACPRAHLSPLPERYIDGAVRDNCAIAVAVRIAGAGLVLGVNLGYAGMRRDKVANGGFTEILGQVVDIVGDDQLDSDLNDAAVTRAKVAILNPMVYDIGTFELEYIPFLIDRGRKVATRFLEERGLSRSSPGVENLRRLFAGVEEPLLFPTPGTPSYQAFPPELKAAYPPPGTKQALAVLKSVSR